ncbi:hypothetical protein DU191_24965 [Salmonella enterica subsp. enterica serovar Sandiego]|nr:hypothetical protein [Salmonella enterica subsp. enterica serovar Sandiego]
MKRIISQIDTTTYPEFKQRLQKLHVDIRQQASKAVKDLLLNPQPKRLRLEKLRDYRKPYIYTIHVTPNHSHKVSFELRGDVAVIRKIGTHKEIDRSP